MDAEGLVRRAMQDAIDCLVTRAGGEAATPEGVRAVLARDGATGQDDPWQWWFRAATGLPVLVSTSRVILVCRGPGPARAACPVWADLPEVVRAAVWTRADADGCPLPGRLKRRKVVEPKVEKVCPGCGAVRLVARSYAYKAAARGGVPCPKCVARPGRKRGAA